MDENISIWEPHRYRRRWLETVYQIFGIKNIPYEIIDIIVDFVQQIMHPTHYDNMLILEQIHLHLKTISYQLHNFCKIPQYEEIYLKYKFFEDRDPKYGFSRLSSYSKDYSPEEEYEILFLKIFSVGQKKKNKKKLKRIILEDEDVVHRKMFVKGFFNYILDGNSNFGHGDFSFIHKIFRRGWVNIDILVNFAKQEEYNINLIPPEMIDDKFLIRLGQKFINNNHYMKKFWFFPDKKCSNEGQTKWEDSDEESVWETDTQDHVLTKRGPKVTCENIIHSNNKNFKFNRWSFSGRGRWFLETGS